MPDPTLESVLLQKAAHLQPGPMSTYDNWKQAHPGGDVRAEVPMVPELNIAEGAANTLDKVKKLRDWMAEAGGTITPEGESMISPWLGNKAHITGTMIEQGAKDAVGGADTWIRRMGEYLKSPSVRNTELAGKVATDAQRATIRAAAAQGNGDLLLKFPKELVDEVLGSPIARRGVYGGPGFVGGPIEAGAKTFGNMAGAYAGGKINDAWRNYTGHNLIPSPTAVINKLMGRNDPEATPQVR